MTKTTLLGSAGIATAATALAQTPEAVIPPAPAFEAPPPPEAPDLPSVHAHLAEVMRRVVAIDDASFSELFNKGVILEPESRVATEAMRGALAMYDHAAALAKTAPVPLMLDGAMALIESVATEGGTALSSDAGLGKALVLINSARLAMDFQPPVEPRPE